MSNAAREPAPQSALGIYALKKTSLTQQQIADIIGVSQATVSRELSRNTGERGYRHQLKY